MNAHVPMIACRAPVENGATFVGTTKLHITKLHLRMLTLWTSLWRERPGVPVGRRQNLDVGVLITKSRRECSGGTCCHLSGWPFVYSCQSPTKNEQKTRFLTNILLLAYVARDGALFAWTSIKEITTVFAEEKGTDERHRAYVN
jgi:hypothetical protein